ncbi:MAG: rane protein [Alphaproteobacteria bacterium]|jgi:TRAP-type C4-dicarboxylate transport system permease small subunit|nr:rane protein [Alphaproteobacteria bacterium]
MLVKLDRALYWVSALVVLVLTGVVVLDVILAQFRLPTYLSSEIGPFLMATIVFFAVPIVTHDESHIRADFFDAFFPAKMRAIIRLFFSDPLFVLYAAVLLAIACQTTWNGYVSGERTQNLLRTPLWIPQLAMIVGLLALLLRTMVILIADARKFRANWSAPQTRQ